MNCFIRDREARYVGASPMILQCMRLLMVRFGPRQSRATCPPASYSFAKMRAVQQLFGFVMRYLIGSVRKRSFEGFSGGSSITATEVCCSSRIRRKVSIALVKFPLNVGAN